MDSRSPTEPAAEARAEIGRWMGEAHDAPGEPAPPPAALVEVVA